MSPSGCNPPSSPKTLAAHLTRRQNIWDEVTTPFVSSFNADKPFQVVLSLGQEPNGEDDQARLWYLHEVKTDYVFAVLSIWCVAFDCCCCYGVVNSQSMKQHTVEQRVFFVRT
uniref:Uncharacterized protein n=1 Tax=Timema poppense TaxID=170557 RepID=A0A7R9H8N0_TIMPO|nr:unnamed protein product [Timema poppensis]